MPIEASSVGRNQFKFCSLLGKTTLRANCAEYNGKMKVLNLAKKEVLVRNKGGSSTTKVSGIVLQ